MKRATIQLEALTCPSCLQKIENAVKRLEGVDEASVKVLFNASKVKLLFDDGKLDLTSIENAIRALGYEVVRSQVEE